MNPQLEVTKIFDNFALEPRHKRLAPERRTAYYQCFLRQIRSYGHLDFALISELESSREQLSVQLSQLEGSQAADSFMLTRFRKRLSEVKDDLQWLRHEHEIIAHMVVEAVDYLDEMGVPLSVFADDTGIDGTRLTAAAEWLAEYGEEPDRSYVTTISIAIEMDRDYGDTPAGTVMPARLGAVAHFSRLAERSSTMAGRRSCLKPVKR